MHEYAVTVLQEDDGPGPELCERWAEVARYRLETLEDRDGLYPEVGVGFDMLDHGQGRFFWERTDEEMADDPPSRVDFEVVEVDPATPPAEAGEVRVVVRIAF